MPVWKTWKMCGLGVLVRCFLLEVLLLATRHSSTLDVLIRSSETAVEVAILLSEGLELLLSEADGVEEDGIEEWDGTDEREGPMASSLG
jgi:hypothetical protein